MRYIDSLSRIHLLDSEVWRNIHWNTYRCILFNREKKERTTTTAATAVATKERIEKILLKEITDRSLSRVSVCVCTFVWLCVKTQNYSQIQSTEEKKENKMNWIYQQRARKSKEEKAYDKKKNNFFLLYFGLFIYIYIIL